MINHGSTGRVAILLCTYNGQDFLAEQLESFASQTYTDWAVWVSDDGSTDGTCSILASYQAKWKTRPISVRRGPGRGFAANFLSLTCDPAVDATYYAYSDQDDIWEADKLERAVKYLASVPSHLPALYCSRTRHIDAQKREIGFSPLIKKPLSFANALTQNVGGGNTMVFNNAARLLLCKAGSDVPVIAHDWWVYLVVTGCGGRAFYDSHPSLMYRQHGGNLIGGDSGWRSRIGRARKYWKGEFRRWNDVHLESLNRIRSFLTTENKATLDQFSKARDQSLIPRVIGLKRSGIYRQTVHGNLGLVAAAIFRKI